MTTPDEKTFATLTKLFEEEFGPIGDRQVLYVHAPGRSEISGNHTDHEGGHVIAGSLDVAVDGVAGGAGLLIAHGTNSTFDIFNLSPSRVIVTLIRHARGS